MPSSVLQVVADPDFSALHPTDQQAALSQFDPDFAKLSPEDFSASVKALQKEGLTRPDEVAPPSAAKPEPMKEQPLSTGEKAQEKTGRFLENLGENTGLYTPNAMAVAKHNVHHPVDDTLTTIKNYVKAQSDTGNLAYKELGKGELIKGGTDLLYSAIPAMGPAMSKEGHQLESGDVAGGLGSMTGLGLGILAGHEMGGMAPGETPVEPGYSEASNALSRESAVKQSNAPGIIPNLSEKTGYLGTKAGIATSKAARQAAYSATKNVGIPIVKGASAAVADELSELGTQAVAAGKENVANIRDNIVEAINNGKGNLTERISSALDQAGETAQALKPKAQAMAEKLTDHIINGGGKLADNVEEVLRGHMELGEDIIGRNFDAIVSKTTDYLNSKANELGLTKEEIQQKVQKVVDSVKDEYQYRVKGGAINPYTGKPGGPVSGGAPDIATDFSNKLENELAGYNSRLAELAHTDPAWGELKTALTRGSTRGGLEESGEKILRGVPGAGKIFAFDSDENLQQALSKSISNAAYYSKDLGYGYWLTNILKEAADDIDNSGRINLEKTINKLNEGLKSNQGGGSGLKLTDSPGATPGRFANFKAGKLVGDDTARATLIRDALVEANKKINRTTSFGGPYSAATALGLGGAVGLISGNPLMGAVVGLGTDLALKSLVRNHFLDPSLPADSLVMDVIRSMPQEQGGTTLTKAVKQSAKENRVLPTDTAVYKSLTAEQKALVDAKLKSLNTRLSEWWGKIKQGQARRKANPIGPNTSSLQGIPAIGQQPIEPVSIAELKIPNELKSLLV